MGTYGEITVNQILPVETIFLNYLSTNFKKSFPKNLNLHDYITVYRALVPQQTNGNDCGLYTLKFAEKFFIVRFQYV